MDKKLVLNIAYNYVITVAKSKPYNIQMKAILNEFNNKSIDINSYIKTFENFNNNNEAFICKDFVYKNNLATYRKFYIVSPSLYLYYTYQTFELYFDIIKKNNIFNYSHIDIFYSGIVNEDFKAIKENCDFNNQYEEYKNKQAEYKNNYVLITDIANFFESINVDVLLSKCNSLVFSYRGKDAINNLKGLFMRFNIASLPQLHYSIASSLLSQIYLVDITREADQLLQQNNWSGVRFVDDFCINLNKKFTYKDINKFLHEYSNLLYKENLNLNLSKTKRLTPKNFEKLISTNKDKSGYDENIKSIEEYLNLKKGKYSVNDSIKKKANSLLEDAGNEFMNFIVEVKKIYKSYGLDIKRYNKKVDKYFSINKEDSSKVIKHFIFNQEWKKEISEIDLKTIIECKELIYFDPMNFTILYCLIHSYLNISKNSHFDQFNNFYDAPLRNLMIFEQLTIQGFVSKQEFHKVKNSFQEIDKNAALFFEKYIFK
ncbi:hypothetical protein [Staphylococcus arlettae]|uniref:hypothetical protein n=2 Tax=Staphylococcus TaxID=1279 RepID=UPI001E55CA21|nr:hypothetical protein [Staphylococcus arlettae]MCD8865285.1 hypothetical protein [Staphylococcus arlettae]